MVHNNTLSNIFKDFAECLNIAKLECTNHNIDSFTKARIILSRLYYACFHKGLEYFESLRTSRVGGKHKKLKDLLSQSKIPEHQTLYSLICKLYDLRIWADYLYTNEFFTNAKPANIGYYMFQVNQILSSNKI